MKTNSGCLPVVRRRPAGNRIEHDDAFLTVLGLELILELLNKHHVEFVVVGGVSAVIHGAPATTFDLDALVRVSEENAERLLATLSDLDARYREHRTTIRPSKEDVLAAGHFCW